MNNKVVTGRTEGSEKKTTNFESIVDGTITDMISTVQANPPLTKTSSLIPLIH